MSPSSQEKVYLRDIESMLRTPYEQAQASQRWLSKQSIALQKWATQQSILLYLKLKNKNQLLEKEIISIAANLFIASNIHMKYKNMYRKNQAFLSKDLILVNHFEANQFTKKIRVSKKREFVLRHIKQILYWRNIEVSWADIAIKLATTSVNKCTNEISAEYIRRICKGWK